MLQEIAADLARFGTPASWAVLGQVLLVDLALAGDNAVVIGTIAAGGQAHHRRLIIGVGIAIALVARIALALVATQLLGIAWIMPVGGLLLLWVAWRLAAELRGDGEDAAMQPPKSLFAGIVAVTIADLSMSLDNVLAVAAAAREHPGLLMIGLVFSIALMAVAANLVARLIKRYSWIGWVGVAVIVFVALRLIWEGKEALLG